VRYGIISDIHGNLEALEKVLDVLEKEEVDKIYCVGDIVGYGADPRKCIDIVQERKIPSVKGNHDSAVCGETDIEYFNPYAKEAVLWTRENLTEPDIEYLAGLPMKIEEEDFTIVHATLIEPEAWNYIFTTYEAHRNLLMSDSQVCFIGHSHVPVVFWEGEDEPIRYKQEPEFKMELQEGFKYLVNVGSVGQPRDGDSRAAFAIYDTESKVLEVRRVEYDIKQAQQKIVQAGLPQFLAVRLMFGE